MRSYKILYICFSLFGIMTLQAQVEATPVVSNDKNWLSSISYDFSGATIGKSVSYFNTLGKGLQQQSWDVLTGRIWTSEVRYDYFNRPVLQTLSAPINNTATFGYATNFILSNNAAVTISQYDSASNLMNPPLISANANSLGWYYSTSNTLDRYQDVSQYPYTRAVYSDLNPGTVKAVLGGNKVTINGVAQWLQSYSFSMPMEINQNSTQNISALSNRKIIKTVSRGVDGVETVAFSDTDGNMLAAARSGNETTSTPIVRQVYSEIKDKGFVDIHIPVGCGGTITLANVNASHQIKVYNLISEALLYSNLTATTVNLTPGFYRFEDGNKIYATDPNTTPVKISYTVNYYDYSLNTYDNFDRLETTTQPLGWNSTNPLKTTYQYNFLGQLTSSNSPDEGQSLFKYRNDGQIRFSQNAEQAKTMSFSYTNYDNLGRPVESGVYTGDEVEFVPGSGTNPLAIAVDNIVDLPDGIPQAGKSQQTFSVYDLPDTALFAKLSACAIPTQEYVQSFVASNVSYTYTQNPETTKTWYSYDVYGRVKWMIQELPELGCVKTINYTYDPIDGQLVKVEYQKYNTSERFIHKYVYNKSGQLLQASTSTDDVTYTNQAKYFYNESGALVRTELADNLQGIDYVYNLNGQLKAINHPSIVTTNDPGEDGVTGTSHATFTGDIFGMGLDYYSGDYARTGTPKTITTSTSGTNQYNGNIKALRWNTQIPNATHSGYTFNYNKNNWLSQATFGAAASTGVITNNASGDYGMTMSYDANGNIKTLTRKGYTDPNGTNAMDNLTYRYGANTSGAVSNRLVAVKDTQDNPNTLRYNDIKNQEIAPLGNTTPQPLDNYYYNDLGQLITNLQDKIAYEYNASGQVSQINALGLDNNPDVPPTYKTIYYNDFSNFTSDNHGWFIQGTNNVTPRPGITLGATETIFMNCPDISFPAPPYGGQVLQFNGKQTNRKHIKVLPNTSFILDFDLILDNHLVSENNIIIAPDPENTPPPEIIITPIIPTVVVNIRKPDGTIAYTQTVTATGDPSFCENYFTAHVNYPFSTTTEEYLTLELVVQNNLLNTGIYNTYSKDQKTYLDNLKLQIATRAKIAFFYNDRGQRVAKESYGKTSTTRFTYVRDASGNVMAVYRKISSPFSKTTTSLVEHTIYGASRIGVYQKTGPTTSNTLYEITDHLGNVRAVMQKTSAGVIALTNKTDYYPFGMPMPNRQTTDGNYRYAFQGQEKDPETGMEAFELRLWDGRLGRWLTTDPKHQYASPYLGMGNNPLSLVDPDGGKANDWFKNDKTGETKWFNSTAGGFSDLKGGSWTNTGWGGELLQFDGFKLLYSFQSLSGKDATDLKLTTYEYDADSGNPTNFKPLSVIEKVNLTDDDRNYWNFWSTFDYSKDRQKKKKVGPIPEGNYYVLKNKIQEFDKMSLMQKGKSLFGRGNMPGAKFSWGSSRFEIYPKKVTIGRGNSAVTRGDFFIHGGSLRGSAGCIDLCSGMSSFVNEFTQHNQNKVHLIVNY